MQNKVVKKINKPVWAMRKCMVSMATHYNYKNGGVPTKLLISQLLLILDCLTSYHIKAKTYTFSLCVAYANYLFCIFINIYENIKKLIK